MFYFSSCKWFASFFFCVQLLFLLNKMRDFMHESKKEKYISLIVSCAESLTCVYWQNEFIHPKLFDMKIEFRWIIIESDSNLSKHSDFSVIFLGLSVDWIQQMLVFCLFYFACTLYYTMRLYGASEDLLCECVCLLFFCLVPREFNVRADVK